MCSIVIMDIEIGSTDEMYRDSYRLRDVYGNSDV